MPNLFDIYSPIYEDDSCWNYYKTRNTIKAVFPKYNLSKDFNIAFVEQYFAAGHKNIPSVKDLSKVRLFHTISAFFLGIHLFYHLGLEAEFNRNHKEGDPEFSYYWFLLCLTHDIGYIKEEESLKMHKRYYEPEDIKIKFNDILQDCGPSLKILKKQVRYTPKLISDYHTYIFKEFKHCEHGIAGAIDFFNGAISYHKLLRAKYGKTESSFTFDGIHCGTSAIRRFKEVASIIAIHNIWMQEDSPLVRKAGLSELIGKKLQVSSGAILFWILTIADAIEPLKRCSYTRSYKKILKAISLTTTRNGDLCKIELQYNSTSLCPSFVKTWTSGIEKLEDWTDIHVESKHDQITLSFSIASTIIR